MQRRKQVPLEYILRFYTEHLLESSLEKVVKRMGTHMTAFEDKLKRSPELQLARKMADEQRGNRESMAEYIVGHLSPRARAVWDELQFWDESTHTEKVDAVLADCPKRIRQELFVHCLIRSSFDLSEACRMIRINMETLQCWREDKNFEHALEEVQWHKKNFFEHALMDLVRWRNPMAVMFVNRTINSDRGYVEKLKLEHTLPDAGFQIDDLDLDLDTRRKVLEAVRRRKEQKQLPAAGNGKPIDV